jgi:hypothetical protein
MKREVLDSKNIFEENDLKESDEILFNFYDLVDKELIEIRDLLIDINKNSEKDSK